MLVGMIFTFVASRKQGKNIRKAVDAFAIPFAKLANYMIPVPSREKLLTEKTANGEIHILPLEQQPENVKTAFSLVNNNMPVRLYNEMLTACSEVDNLAGINRTRKRQFSQPINEYLSITHIFLTGCENPNNLDTEEKVEKFNSYLTNQAKYRYEIMKRISAESGDDYRSANKKYQTELEELEKEEREKKRNKR